MREIKFRQWNSIKKRYQYDIGATGPGSWSGPSYCSWDTYPLEQFTGLQDRNGKDIYEGDIIYDEWAMSLERDILHDERKRPLIVCWDKNGKWCASIMVPIIMDNKEHEVPHWLFDGVAFHKCEVVGNIHQPPKELK